MYFVHIKIATKKCKPNIITGEKFYISQNMTMFSYVWFCLSHDRDVNWDLLISFYMTLVKQVKQMI